MSVAARVQFNAEGFGRNPKKSVTITLDATVDGLAFDALKFEEAKELLVRMAIQLTNPETHEKLARDLASLRRSPLRRVK